MPLRLYLDHLDDAYKETKKKWLSAEKVVCCVQLDMLLAAITISSMRVAWECGSVSDDVKLKYCSKCDATEYCSRECQVAAWRGGHKQKCFALKSRYSEFRSSLNCIDDAHKLMHLRL